MMPLSVIFPHEIISISNMLFCKFSGLPSLSSHPQYNDTCIVLFFQHAVGPLGDKRYVLRTCFTIKITNCPSLARTILVLGLKILCPGKPLSPRKTWMMSYPKNHTRYSLYRLCWWAGPFWNQMPRYWRKEMPTQAENVWVWSFLHYWEFLKWWKFDKDSSINKALNFKPISTK